MSIAVCRLSIFSRSSITFHASVSHLFLPRRLPICSVPHHRFCSLTVNDEIKALADSSMEYPSSLSITLDIRDRDIIRVMAPMDSTARKDYALAALKIGAVALERVSGQLDAHFIQNESTRLVARLREELQDHAKRMHDKLSSELAEYFNPKSGRFTDRVDRLIKRDGELEQLLSRAVGGEGGSQLSQTLAKHLGKGSDLMRILDPKQSDGLVLAIKKVVEESTGLHKDKLLGEFSLDNKQSALSRMVAELKTQSSSLSHDVQILRNEFSLDKTESALSRLVRSMEKYQKDITKEFDMSNQDSALSRFDSMLQHTNQTIAANLTLDNESSSLSRLRKEMLSILEEHKRTSTQFQEQVKVAMAQMASVRRETDKSPKKGINFEDALARLLSAACTSKTGGGDFVTQTTATVGLIKNCKIGDVVVELGPESVAPGAKIVFEAKNERGFDSRKQMDEIEIAKKNRAAQIGVFVVAKGSTANADELNSFTRHGNNLFVQWDAEDHVTDVFVLAALSAARALCVRQSKLDASSNTGLTGKDLDKLDKCLVDIEKHATNMDEIEKLSKTIENANLKILKRVDLDRTAILNRLKDIEPIIASLKNAFIDNKKKV